MLPFLAPVIFKFEIQSVLKLKKNSGAKGLNINIFILILSGVTLGNRLNPLNAELNPISRLPAMAGAPPFCPR
jgi:hypothetical protein